MIKDLIQRIFGMKEITEQDLDKERNILLSKIPLNKQADAFILYENYRKEYIEESLKTGTFYFEIHSKIYANYKLKQYVRRVK